MLKVAALVEQCWHRVPGGTAVAAVRLLDALAKRGDCELMGVAARHRHPPPTGLVPSIPVRHSRLPRRILYDSWHSLRRPSITGLAGRVDIIHATGGAVPPAGRTPLVASVHDLAFVSRPDWFTKRGVRFATRALALAQAEAAAVIAPSQATARDLLAAGIDDSRIRVVPLGVEQVAVSDQEIEEVRSRYRLPEMFALWVGTAEPRKNLAGLLRAAEATTSAVPLVLAGPDGWNIDAESLCAAARCEVIRVGFVNRRELAALYRAARVFVYPSFMEGFGLPLLEAMAQGTPVVTSAGTATEEVCADTASVVDPADHDGLVQAIDLVVTDDAEHARRSKKALARAAEFTWDSSAAQLFDIYREVAE